MKYELNEIASVTKLAGFEFTKYIKYISDGEIIAIRALNLKNGGLVLDDIRRISRVVSDNLERSKLYKNDIVLSYTGTIGECAQIVENNKYHLAPNVCKITPDTDKVDPNFLFYYVRSRFFKQLMLNYCHGSTQPTIPMKTIRALPIDIPINIDKQRKVADVLMCIDKKININAEMNNNLADVIQTIYQKRFTSNLQGKLSDICTYSKERIHVDELTLDEYFSTENMLPNKAGAITATSLPSTLQTTKCHIGDVLISNIRPYFKKILYCHHEGGCSSDVLCFSPSSKKLSAFLYGVLYSDSFFDFMVAGSKGTKMPRGDKQQIMTYPIYVPTHDELDEYNAIAIPILDEIYRNTREILNLSSLRDTLIPRLISGEIDVTTIEI